MVGYSGRLPVVYILATIKKIILVTSPLLQIKGTRRVVIVKGKVEENRAPCDALGLPFNFSSFADAVMI